MSPEGSGEEEPGLGSAVLPGEADLRAQGHRPLWTGGRVFVPVFLG